MEPKFHDGDLIFIDPQVSPDSGKYVVVLIEDSHEAMFKQLILEGDRQYLKALNPDWPNRIIEVDSNATICGVVVFKGELV
jgi:SOS-response transcriptional repressor LexA